MNQTTATMDDQTLMANTGWTNTEESIVRTAVNEKHAVDCYRQRFGNKHSRNYIIDKWHDAKHRGQLVKHGTRVKLIDNASVYAGKVGKVRHISDTHFTATIEFEDKVQMQVSIGRLETVVEAEK